MSKLVHIVNTALYAINGLLWALYAHAPLIAIAWFAVAIASAIWARKLDIYI